MTVLPALDVYRMIKAGELVIEPFELREELTPPASIDLRVSARTVKYSFQNDEYLIGERIEEDEGLTEDLVGNIYSLDPGNGAIFILYEKIILPPTLAAIVLPRSSLTRLGVGLQPTYLNPGYQGNCPVLLTNHATFTVKIPFREGIGPRLAQVLFLKLGSLPHRKYGEGLDEKYQDELGIPARFDRDVDIVQLLEPLRQALDKI